MHLNKAIPFTKALPWLVFPPMLVAYAAICRRFFPLPNGLMGNDYAIWVPAYLDGFRWFTNNGFLSPPWFSPSFCGGQVFFADPQSAFYSLPQFLTFVHVDPVRAAYVSTLVFASAGFWGMYFLVKNRFSSSTYAAVCAAVLFMFNGFFAARMMIGHLSFQGVMLIPWIASLLMGKEPLGLDAASWRGAILAGLLLAYWQQSGLAVIMVPAGLAVLAVGLFGCALRGNSLADLLAKGALAGSLALALSASKLTASLAMLRHFPRTDYVLPGFDSAAALANVLFHSFFFSAAGAASTAEPLWRNGALMPHEVAFSITPIALAILATGAMLHIYERLTKPLPVTMPASHTRWAATVLLILVLAVPCGVLYFDPAWNAFLKTLPVLASTTASYRWALIYLPILVLLAALMADCSIRFAQFACIAVVLGVPLLGSIEDRTYYYLQGFDPAPVLGSYRALSSGQGKPEITAIAVFRQPDGSIVMDNSLMAQGLSSLICYNALYGYGLEHFQIEPLVVGPVLASLADGKLNLRNPACLLYPRENGCRLWDSFTTAELDKARAFATYQPFAFRRSTAQSVADCVTEAALVLTMVYGAWTLGTIRKRRNGVRVAAESPARPASPNT
jgi:hypothetical protein